MRVRRYHVMNARRKTMTSGSGMSKSRKRKLYLKGADFLLDIAKLVFGGVILSGIIDLELNKVALFSVGAVVVAMFTSWGFFLYLRGTKTD